APNVATALEGAAQQAGRTLNLILDPGSDPLIPGDTAETQVVSNLRSDLQAQLNFLWAPVRTSSRVNAFIFPTAYHIKVAVRDGLAFWLSSGNWKSSNQGAFDPIAGDTLEDGQGIPPTQVLPSGFLGQHDRDWHVVVEHPGLAAVLEKYILHDMSQAAP